MEVHAYEITLPITVFPFKKHKQHKDELLLMFDRILKKSFTNNTTTTGVYCRISNHDFDNNNHNINYFDLISDSLLTDIKNIYLEFGIGDVRIANHWFQQYNTNDTHSWHIHGRTNLAGVYFLELPDQSLATEFVNPCTKEIFKINVKEGDVIIFPSTIVHRSPKNLTGKRKTSIAFNLSTHDGFYSQ